MNDFIINNEKKKHSSYGMNAFYISLNEIIHRFWDSV
jgi:hypothetical protein